MFDARYEDIEGNSLWNDHEYKFLVNGVAYTGIYKTSRHALFSKSSMNKICGVEEAKEITNTTPSTI